MSASYIESTDCRNGISHDGQSLPWHVCRRCFTLPAKTERHPLFQAEGPPFRRYALLGDLRATHPSIGRTAFGSATEPPVLARARSRKLPDVAMRR
jgi:hypothetical protein